MLISNLALRRVSYITGLRSCYWFDEIESTSTFLRNEIAQLHDHLTARSQTSSDLIGYSASEILKEYSYWFPRLVGANRQSSGRGRGDHQWYSPEGCLMFTLAIPYDFDDTEMISPRVGLAIAKFLETHVDTQEHRVGIKWPNDLMIQSRYTGKYQPKPRKICGFLMESVRLYGSKILLIGVGLNVRLKRTDIPFGLSDKIVSLDEVSSESIATDVDLLIAVGDTLIKTVHEVKNGSNQDQSVWIREYRQRSLNNDEDLN